MKGTSHQVDDVTGHRFVTGHTSPVRHSFGAFHLPSPGGWPSPHIYLPHGVNSPRSALPLVAMSLGPCLYCQVYSSEKFSPSYIPPPYTLQAISLYPTRLCPPAPSYVPHPISSELYPFTPYLPGYAPPPHTSRAMPGAAPLRPRLRTVVPFALHSGRSSPPRAARMMVGGGVGPDGLPLC